LRWAQPANLKPWPCTALSLKLFVALRAVFRQEVGDILNSLQGKRSKNKHVQALLKLLTPKLAQFDSKLSMISLSMTLYG
jgi:hypothetical protein